MNKILKIVVDIMFAIIILALVGYLILRFTGKIEIYSVKTGSMEELIHAGDYVLIYKNNNFNVGDIVTYQIDDYYITHRIIEKKDNNKYITKGDANNISDEEIDASQIIGKVIISGGLLNIIIDYKFVIVLIILSIYLISCYYDKNKIESEES